MRLSLECVLAHTLLRHTRQAQFYTAALSSGHLLPSSTDSYRHSQCGQRCAVLLRLNPSTTKTNLMRLERCKQCICCLFLPYCVCAVAFLAYNFPTLSESHQLQIAVAENTGNQVTNMLLRWKNSNHNGTEPRPQTEFTDDA